MSLCKPHQLFLTASDSTYEVIKATIQAKMLSGRYRTEKLCRFWSQNRKGICLFECCRDLEIPEDLHHILSVCPALEEIRGKLHRFTNSKCSTLPSEVTKIVIGHTRPCDPLFVHFLLDCSQFPEVIRCVQKYGPKILATTFHITRTWCYSLHRERLKMLNRWKNFK